ncbi:helix-turn-helix domain-containing protein [uncultured Aeromicrobium sp.]|uniref:winged helix-turn-helix transcriptional regulator n=1 Tax=uncultured Aeromicrobium sp. TaxID=337820 RepID=UPI0025D6E1B1|nr:helix-turn-helix domain-containing protein [uncultured Aeromicrobium sp.]
MGEYQQFCGLARALDIVGDRWNLLIIRELLICERRHGELKAALPGIATNLLSDRLRNLVHAGIVLRREEPGRKAVRYALTPLGLGLREPVLALVRWGAQLMVTGPRPGESVQPQWLALAIEALLPRAGLPEATVLIRSDGQDFTLLTSAEGARVEIGAPSAADATVEAPTAATLGLFSGMLPADSPALSTTRTHDPNGRLAELLAHALQHQDRDRAVRGLGP